VKGASAAPEAGADRRDGHDHDGSPSQLAGLMSVSAGAARALESGGIRDSKFVFHPAGHPSLGIGQRGI
jgi:hypothetical protein